MTQSPLHLHADIGIGGIHVRLHTDSQAYLDVIGERFAGFIEAVEQPDYQFDVTLVEPRNGAGERVHVSRNGELWRVQRGDFLAEWDPRTRRGWIRQVLSPFSLDSVIRIVITLVLAGEGGMLMHASSAIRNGRAYIFTGVSGVGKTTISRLAPADTHLLTDEMSFIRRDGDGYRAFGTPFAGELAKPGENMSAPLAGIFLLAQGPENRIDELSPTEAVRGVLANILFFAQDQALVKAVFDSAIALAAKVPVRRLTFLPDARVWELIGNPQA